MAIEISKALAALPATGLTVTALKATDLMAPGVWSNPRDLTAMIEGVTPARGEQVARVRERAEGLFLSPEEPFLSVYGLFTFVDVVDRKHLLGTLRDRVPSVETFLDRFVPHVAVSQELDSALKLATEALTFALLRGTRRDDPDAFIAALSARRYDVAGMVRMAAWIAFEGVLPFGASFMPRITDALAGMKLEALSQNALFGRLASLAPGTTVEAKRAYMVGVLQAATPWAESFVSSHGLTQEALSKKVMSWFSVLAGGRSVALASDTLTDYFSHTGAQTVARAALVRAWIDLYGPQYSPMAPDSPEQDTRIIAVGRDSTPGVNHVVIDAPMVSGQHLEAIPGDGGWFVRDLGSTNGTFLGVRVKTQRFGQKPRFVAAADTLFLGSHRFPVARLAAASRSASPRPAPTVAVSQPAALKEAQPDADVEEEYTRREQAWVQIICLAAVTDGHLEDTEREFLSHVAATFPLMMEVPERWGERRLNRTLRDIRRRGFAVVIREALDALTCPDERLEALRLAALVTRADAEVLQEEARFLERLAAALGLPEEALALALEGADADKTEEIILPPRAAP